MSDRDCNNCAHHSEGGCSVWECSFEQKEDDTISRQAAVDAICGECQANCIPCEYFPCGEIKAIQALPPAQQNLQPTCNNLATDAISRQAAIDTLLKWMRPICINNTGEVVESDVMVAVRNILKTVPSVQPEPLSDAYMKAVWTWLLDYQINVAKLKGRYTPYEVLSWVANDWRKEHE